MSVLVRRATPADASEIAACLAALGYGTPAPLVADRLAAFAASAVDAVFVAESAPDARLRGVVSAHALSLFHAPGRLVRLTALAVRDGAQGAGVGRALVVAAEAWAWSVDARRVEVTSGDHRPGAHAFYQALGYALDERRFVKHAPPTSAASEADSREPAS
jgi:GNAT superfamily N-acetyltransferase